MRLRPYERPWALRPFVPLWSDIFDDGAGWFGERFRAPVAPHVRVDVEETPDEVVVSAEIPGLERSDQVDIEVRGRTLELRGAVERASERREANLHRMERYYGRFARTVPLPADVDESRARATYRNGVLEVRLPKAERQTGRRVPVEFR
ncbi:MAG: Hsp20/alpha crystallin family protein [Firmicutes bacterium]|nr:Hsp20/alpha crystallin family protein [Bacillota bacterium]